MEPILTTVFGKTVISTCVNKVIGIATSLGQKKLVKVFSKFKVDGIVENYFDKVVSRVITFKTLNGDGKDVKLNDIYYPLELLRLGDDAALEIGSGVTLKYNGCICIRGNAGQGKTTIMRKLFVEELILGERFPFFLTLRDVDFSKVESSIELLRDHLNIFGVICNDAEIEALISSGRIIVFFDGFDEISPDLRLKALRIIESLHLINSCPSIVTTRPDTELLNLTGLECYTVLPLSKKDVFGVIKKIVSNAGRADEIMVTLKNNESLHEAINIPILVSLFVLIYDSFSDEPKNITDFYEVIFLSLIYKHDKSKNYKRVRKSGMNNHSLEYCFSVFSYLSLAESMSTFNEATIGKYFRAASSHLGKEELSESIMDDILNGTNLIVPDGHDRYVYIHRSIQEYFSAKCISEFDEESKKEYYSGCVIHRDDLVSSRQVLKTLSAIDGKYFSKFYLLPILKNAGLIDGEDEVLDCTPESFLDYISVAEVGFYEKNGKFSFRMLRTKLKALSTMPRVVDDIVGIITYKEHEYALVLHKIVSSVAKRYASNFLQRNGLTESEFTKKYASPNVSIDGALIEEVEWKSLITLKEFFGSDGIPLEVSQPLAEYANKGVEVIRNYLNNNYFFHRDSTKKMLGMLPKRK